MIVAIIPARGGSKRLKNKNIKKFYNKPIISYPINIALKCKIFDFVIVSTDSKNISVISKKYGANVFFKRPKSISNDTASTQKVIIHSIKWLEKNIKPVKYICCIYPATPLLKTSFIKKSFQKLKKGEWDFLISAIKYTNPIQKALYIKNQQAKFVTKKLYNKKGDKLQRYFHDAGQFYWGTKKGCQKKKMIENTKTTIYEIPKHFGVDINTQDDWNYLLKLYKIFKNT